MYQRIEGLNISDLNWGTADASTVTLSFWVRSSITGNFPVFLQNSAYAVYYASLYNIPTANTWTKISITITGPTTGTWLTTNGIGIDVNWGFGAGSGLRTVGTTGAWTSNPTAGVVLFNITGATQLIGTSGATFYITGVQLEKGSTATSFDYRPYSTELALCERYCIQFTSTTYNNPLGGIGIFLNGSASGLFGGRFRMRAAPTATYTGAGPYMADAAGDLKTVSSVSVYATGANNFVEWQFNFPAMGGGAYGGKSCYFITNVGSYLRLDAEL
jgi:hypothetical protein